MFWIIAYITNTTTPHDMYRMPPALEIEKYRKKTFISQFPFHFQGLKEFKAKSTSTVNALTLAWVALPAASIGCSPGLVVVERCTPLAVIARCVVGTHTLARYLRSRGMIHFQLLPIQAPQSLIKIHLTGHFLFS